MREAGSPRAFDLNQSNILLHAVRRINIIIIISSLHSFFLVSLDTCFIPLTFCCRIRKDSRQGKVKKVESFKAFRAVFCAATFLVAYSSISAFVSRRQVFNLTSEQSLAIHVKFEQRSRSGKPKARFIFQSNQSKREVTEKEEKYL